MLDGLSHNGMRWSGNRKWPEYMKARIVDPGAKVREVARRQPTVLLNTTRDTSKARGWDVDDTLPHEPMLGNQVS